MSSIFETITQSEPSEDNLQVIFDRVKNHLLTQNAKSSDPYDVLGDEFVFNCRYRSNNGLKCAIGCLITDKNYHPSLEGFSINNPVIYNSLLNALKKSGIDCTTRMLEMLDALRELHDGMAVSYWEMGLKNIAAEYFLNWNTRSLNKNV